MAAVHHRFALDKLILPIHDLIGVYVMQLGQLGQGLLSSDRIQRHFGLERR